jgi:tetratricopeptide (TPR) repeat protein
MDALIRQEDYAAAMKDLEMYMQQNPKNSALFYEKAIIQLSMKDSIGAENSLSELLKQDSTNSLGWSASGLLKMQKNNLKAAYSDYSKAIENKSTYFGDYINRGIINVKQNNFREALSDYNRAIELESKSDLAYYNRALLRVSLGDNNNALSDFNKIIELDSTHNEEIFQRAMLFNKLGQNKAAIADFQKIIKKYPYFLPAFWGIAEAEAAMGNQKNAFKYRQLAYNIENNKDEIQKNKQNELKTDNKIATNTQKSSDSRKTELFNRYITRNVDDNNSESKYEDELRGNIQNRNVDVLNEKNFILTYYAKQDEIRRTNLYHPIVDDYNKEKQLFSNLKLTNNDIALTSELVNTHFEIINNISQKLSVETNNADLFFYRAIEFALVQDFNSAVEDLNRALSLRPTFTLAYFYRANIRYKLIEYLRNTANDQSTSLNEHRIDEKNKTIRENQFKIDVELMMRDYDKVMELQADFRFAYYNKANILCTQQDFKSAIANYNKAIEIEPDFAEAYFNRGLTYLFIGENEKGLSDLSKAGELGIYQSYNLIQKFEK